MEQVTASVQRVTALLKRAGLISRASRKVFAYGGLYHGFTVTKEWRPRGEKPAVRVRYSFTSLSPVSMPNQAEAIALAEPVLTAAGFSITRLNILGDWLVTEKEE